jgi:hypothetical protein
MEQVPEGTKEREPRGLQRDGRAEFPGAFYPIIARGNQSQDIFGADRDRIGSKGRDLDTFRGAITDRTSSATSRFPESSKISAFSIYSLGVEKRTGAWYDFVIHPRRLTMKRRRVAVTISLPPEIARDYQKMADREAKNKSQLFRDMFSLYREKILEREFFDLQRYGSKMARERGILTEKDVERIVFEDR